MTRTAGSSEERTDKAGGPHDGWTTGLFTRWLHLAVLSSLVVAQPLLDLLGRHPEFFVAQGIRRDGIFILVATLLVVPPLPFIAVEAITLFFPRKFQKMVHLAFVGFFSLLLALLMIKRFGEPPFWIAITSAGIVALAAATAYLKLQPVRSFITLMAIGLLVIPAGFLVQARAAGLMAPLQFSGRDLPKVDCDEPIVFIVFDEFSTPVLLDENGSINRLRYPNIAALADTATWYPKAVTIAEFTMIAVPAILSGVRPQHRQLPTFEAHPENLFSLFGGSYDVWALETMTSLCPQELNRRGIPPQEAPFQKAMAITSDLWIVFLHLLAPDAVVHELPPISNTWGAFGDRAQAPDQPKDAPSAEPERRGNVGAQEVRSDRRRRVGEFIDALQDCDDHSLYFLHVMLPHGPWDLLPGGQRYPAERGVIWGVERKENRWTKDDFLPMQAYQRYILQTMYVDWFVGEVRRTLEELGVFDRALVVLVADHGVSFEPGQLRRNANLENAHEILPVPLLIKAPRQREAKVVDRLVSILDVLPTVTQLLDVGSPWAMDGVPQTAEELPREHQIEFVVSHGGTYEVQLSFLDGMDEVVGRKLRVFGDGSDPLELFRIGNYPEMVGRRVSDFRIEEPLGLGLAIDDEEMYRGVDLSAATLPVFVQGSVKTEGEQLKSRDLVIAVNGTIGAVVPIHPGADTEGRFTALIPPSFLRQGENDLDVYLIEDSSGGLIFYPL